MVPGGTTESIAHFIGYLHLLEDAARSHPSYAGVPGGARPQTSADPLHHEGRPDLSLEDGASRPITQDYKPGDFSLIDVSRHKLLPPPKIAVPHPHLGHVPPVDAGPHDPGLPSDAIYLRGEEIGEVASVTPAPLPDQLLADLRQVNVLHDDGFVATMPATPAMTIAAQLQDAGAAFTLPALLDQSRASTPDWLTPAGPTGTLIRSVAAHDAEQQAHATPATPPGLYTDGALQPEGTAFHPTVPDANTASPASHNGLTDPGTAAETGGNTAINIASILDDHTEHTGFVVMGNSYVTDAIIQTNVLHSIADIAVGGDAGLRTVDTGDNTAHNLARFAQHDLSAGFVSANIPWAHLQLDTINGDFYDVKAFSQINYLSNNDLAVQTASSAFSEISTGGNLQVSDISFSELAQHYDLIIVGGSYHNTNAIVQQNIFLNDDVIRMLSGRDDLGSQSITTGHNSLSNTASIDHYGATTTQAVTPDLATWLSHVDSGSWTPEEGSPLPSTGSSLMHVLYIRGDFFDINALSQTNVVSNADTVAQMMPYVGSTLAPTGVPTASTMAIDTGHNQLANLAGITVVGTTSAFQFVGGQHYDDAILVQANLVSGKAHVVIGDTHTLASELVAFTGVHDAMPTPAEHAAVSPVDPSLHHDLFHGMMT